MTVLLIYTLAIVITVVLLSILSKYGRMTKEAEGQIVMFSIFWWAFWPLALTGLFYYTLVALSIRIRGKKS